MTIIGPILWMLLIVPLPLLVLECFKPKPPLGGLIILGISAVVLLLAVLLPAAKTNLLGPNYSPRLYGRIELNLVAVVAAGIYVATKRQSLASIAALILFVEWLGVAVANVAV